MRYAAATTVLLITLSVLFIFIPNEGSDATSSETAPDGSVYLYDTYGSGHPNYYCEITDADTAGNVVHIPTVLEGYDVRNILPGAFDGCTAKCVIIPVNVKSISAGAFTGCTQLTDVYFMGDRPAMDNAFSTGVGIHYLPGTTGWSTETAITTETSDGITYAQFPDGWMAVGGTPTNGAITIKSNIGGGKVTSVGPYSFSGTMQPSGEVERRTDIVSVHIESGVTDIRERAFYYCNIQNIEMTDSVIHIHDEAFRSAMELTDASISPSAEYIGFECYRDCQALTSITVPDSVRYLGDGCFYICNSAETLKIGSGVQSIPVRGFGYCTSLTDVTFNCSPTEIKASAFYNCPSLRSISIPDSVKTIGQEAFWNCTSLTELSLGKVTSIEYGAFRNCTSLRSFNLPSTVESLGKYCFADCTKLSDIDAYGPCPVLDDTVFLNDPVTIHCSKDNYDSWNDSEADTNIKDDLDKKEFNIHLVVIPIVIIIAGIVLFAIVYKRHG